MAIRLVLFSLAYTLAEVAGVLALGAAWLVSGGGRRLDLAPTTFAIQRHWAGFVFRACRGVFDLRISATGLEAVQTPPFVVFGRHASLVDNLLPAWFISRPHRTHIRYVMKRELLFDPALDVAGNRLPNLFVRRDAPESDLPALRRLAGGLPASEAILIYPEGTRFSTEKLDRARQDTTRRNPTLAARARDLRHVLPPRPAGSLAILETCDADVVVMAHRGLDGFARLTDVWRGAMVRRDIEVAFWRVARSDIPAGRSERTEWLVGVWAGIDEWIGRPA